MFFAASASSPRTSPPSAMREGLSARPAGRRRRIAVLAALAALGHLADQRAPRLDGVGHRARLLRRQLQRLQRAVRASETMGAF